MQASRDRSAPVQTSYALASAIALALGCAVDRALQQGAYGAGPGFALLGLVVFVGVLHGTALDALFAWLARSAAWLRTAVWALVSFGATFQLARALGVFTRLGGRYDGLALYALGACALAACALTGTLLLLQPTAACPVGLLGKAPARIRFAAAGLFAIGAAASFVLDASVYVGLYPALHTALRYASFWLAMLAVASTCGSWLPGLGVQKTLAVAGVAAVAALLATANLGVHVHALYRSSWSAAVLEAAQQLTDVDFDGYGSSFGGSDCAAFEARVHPGAVEAPDNGVDDNCLLGDRKSAAAAPIRTRAPAAPSPTAPMDVVLITIDALRADHVGTYDARYAKRALATTPHLDAFAARARVFEHAYTAGGWTSISLSALMRGVYPRSLSFQRVYETNRYRMLLESERTQLRPGEHFAKMFPLPRTDRHPTLTQLLREASVRTVAAVNDEYAQVLARDSGVAPDFDVYREVDGPKRRDRNDRATARAAIAELRQIPPDQRFFLWVHFFGPHSPSRRHRSVRMIGDGVSARYDHEIRYTDAQLRRLLRAIDERGTQTAVFVTADHGEDLIGNGRHHGFSLDTSVTRVPLIAKVPGWGRGRVTGAVSLVDLMPTILSLQGARVPAHMQGETLALAVSAPDPARAVFADTWQYDGRGVRMRAETAAMNGKRRAVFDPLRGTFTLYDPDVPGSAARDVEASSPDPLVRALTRYVESGGAPQLSD